MTDTQICQCVVDPIVTAPSPYFFISSICLVHMKVFAKFDETPSKILQDLLLIYYSDKYICEYYTYKQICITPITFLIVNENIKCVYAFS